MGQGWKVPKILWSYHSVDIKEGAFLANEIGNPKKLPCQKSLQEMLHKMLQKMLEL